MAMPKSEDPAVLRGAVLRAWREHAGVSLRELARRIPAAPGAVSMWESGQRGTRTPGALPVIAVIAQKLDLAGHSAQAFSDMWQAAGSVTAGDPRRSWSHNFQDPSGPAWAWLRCPDEAEKLAVTGWWSDVFQGSLDMPVGPGGVFVQFPGTIPNPPLEARFDEPGGWADFGRGVVPDDVAERLGAVVLDARQHLRVLPVCEPPLGESAFRQMLPAIRRGKETVELFGVGWSFLAPHLGFGRDNADPHPLDEFSRQELTGVELDGSGRITSQFLVDHVSLRRLRDARGMSREAAAAAATDLEPPNPLSASALRALEDRGAALPATRIISRLDTVYGADGRVGIDRTFDSRWDNTGDGIRFPPYWQGPVWLQFHAPSSAADGLAELVWGYWRRRQYVRPGMVLTTRKATKGVQPLTYSIPGSWHVTAGTGMINAALDINHGWYPRSVIAAINLLRVNIRAVLRPLRNN